MPRRPRADTPDSWHHVINRAIARRTLLERRDDFRFFMAQIARAVRRGEIELHVFCLMGTHYHLLLRSVGGELGKAMQRVQLAYSRWFNRTRKRDGPLVRGRYFSKPVESLAYRRTLVRYIDSNAVTAGIVSRAVLYPYGSAIHYAKRSGPPWLQRSWIEEVVRSETGMASYEPSSYSRVFGRMPDNLVEVVEARLAHKSSQDPLDNLVLASSDQVRAWMLRKARLADGTAPDMPIISLGWLETIILAHSHEPWEIKRGRFHRNAWPVARAGLGRKLCGASLTRLAQSLEVSHSTVSNLCRIHDQEVHRGEEYSTKAALIAHQAIQSWRGV